MKTLLLSVLILAFEPLAWAQEHAPLAAQCQADVALWDNPQKMNEYSDAEMAHVKSDTPNRADINKLSFTELNKRIGEMAECAAVDSARFADYARVSNFYSDVVSDRFRSFVYRHNLIDQLKREDAEGKR